MKVLVTGGAGYIGSTVVSALRDAGQEPVVVDDLSTGSAEFLADVPHVIGDFADPRVLATAFAEPGIDVAIHCAARTVVSDSVTDPLEYYRENVAKSVQFVQALLERGCTGMIFSSSAAVYGPATGAVSETSPTAPQTPYARSKLMVEQLLADVCAATGLRALSLRYFNPVGCDPRHRSWPADPDPTHALGSLMRAWADERPFRINGADWDTADGSPVRDFVHVWDVATAHVAAARYVTDSLGHDVVNIGSGKATSIRQLAEVFNRLVERPVVVEVGPRRPGDIAGAHTSTAKARHLLDWEPSRSVADAISDLLGLADRQPS